MNTLEQKAITCFQSGYNCAQSVLSAYTDEFQYDNTLAMELSCGFGGGMGRLQKTCGAVTGSFMVIGIYNSRKFSDIKTQKEQSYKMVQSFSEKFKSMHGTLDCDSLLKCNLNTDEGHLFFKENNLAKTMCEQCIKDSLGIIEELIRK